MPKEEVRTAVGLEAVGEFCWVCTAASVLLI